MDASRVAGGPRADSAHRNSAALRRAAVAFAFLSLTLSAAPGAYATDIYARAIGQEYLPEAPPPAPARKDDDALPNLPALGSERVEPQARGETRFWYRLLIGTVLVAAIAALGDDGATPGVSVGTGAPAPTPDTPGPGNNGNNAGSGNGGAAGAGNGGGPGISVEVGLGGNDDRPRGGPRGRDRDDDDRGRGRRGGDDD